MDNNRQKLSKKDKNFKESEFYRLKIVDMVIEIEKEEYLKKIYSFICGIIK